MALLRRIRQCLYDQGYTIKGVQKLLREGALRTGERGSVVATTATQAAPRPSRESKQETLRQTLIEIRNELAALREALAKRRG